MFKKWIICTNSPNSIASLLSRSNCKNQPLQPISSCPVFFFIILQIVLRSLMSYFIIAISSSVADIAVSSESSALSLLFACFMTTLWAAAAPWSFWLALYLVLSSWIFTSTILWMTSTWRTVSSMKPSCILMMPCELAACQIILSFS